MSAANRTPSPGRPIRALVLTRMWPTRERPHYGTFVKDEVDAVCRLGVECHVVTEAGAGGARCYIRLWRKMSMALREGNFDVVHAHYGTAGWVGRLQRSAPLVVTFHGSDLMGGRRTGRGRRSIRGYVEMALALLLARIVRDVIVVSPTLLARTPGGRASVITPGVDLTRFFPTERTEARRSLGVEVKQRMVLFVANPALANKRYALAHDAVQIAR